MLDTWEAIFLDHFDHFENPKQFGFWDPHLLNIFLMSFSWNKVLQTKSTLSTNNYGWLFGKLWIW